MASRLRLFVKKRGSRRTGPRWTGQLAEALLFLGLLAVGGYGLYWLIAHTLLAEGSSHGWWPWFAIIIPVALIGYGATGLVMLLWQNAASSERRAAAVQKATDWELPNGKSKSLRPSLPTVPSIDSVTDSPGVCLAHRMPIDGASGWVSFTMAGVCLVWNTLVVIFVVQVIRQHLAGHPNWLLTWLMVPFVLAGGWTLVALGRQVLFDFAIGATRLEVSQLPFYPGGAYQVFVSQSGRLRVRWFQVHLVCEEQAVYQQGTDTRRDTSQVYGAILFSRRKFEITRQQAFETVFEFHVPESAMHSFISPHNGVIWSLVVRGRMARWGEFERRFPVFVYPASTISPPLANPVTSTVGSKTS